MGLETIKRLGGSGCRIIFTARSKEKGDNVLSTLPPSTSASYVVMDLASFKSVREASAEITSLLETPEEQEPSSISVLLNNAGVMALPDRRLTSDGNEFQFQTNHLGHFLFTLSLINSRCLDLSSGRVINVASSAYQFARNGLNFDDLNASRSYSAWDAYGKSKLSNLLFTLALDKRFKDKGWGIRATSLHPGVVRTDLGRYLFSSGGGEERGPSSDSGLLGKLGLKVVSLFTKSVEEGADTQIWLSAGNGGDVGGKFYVEKRARVLGENAIDVEAGEKLWRESERLTEVKWEEEGGN